MPPLIKLITASHIHSSANKHAGAERQRNIEQADAPTQKSHQRQPLARKEAFTSLHRLVREYIKKNT